MILLPESQDDLYINAMIHLAVQSRDPTLAFDLDTSQKIEQLVMAEIRLKLSDLFASFSDTKHRSITPLADSLFARGWSLERGISGTQDFQAAAQIYRQAAARGSLEALYRLGWLVENEFIIEHIQTADQLYQQAADAGHVKSLIACGQRCLFSATDRDSLIRCRDCFAQARQIEPLLDHLYLDFVNEWLEHVHSNQDLSIAEHLEQILPIPGHFKQGESRTYQRGIESNIRLARFLQKQHKKSGHLFMSWCHRNGLGIPQDRKEGLRQALHITETPSGIEQLYLAWIFLTEDETSQIETGIHLLKKSSLQACSAAQDDLAFFATNDLLNPHSMRGYLSADHKPLKMEQLFGFDD